MWAAFLSILLFAGFGQISSQGFREVALERHNHFRGLNHLQPLYLDYQLSVIAQRHAEKLAKVKELQASHGGYHENLWSRKGVLRPLNYETRDAVNSWYTGSQIPGNTKVSVDHHVLRSNETQALGIGVGTNEDFTIVVAEYN